MKNDPLTPQAPILRRLSETFYPNDDLKELFGDAPVYVDATLVREELLEACHITFRINASACVKRLQQLKARGDETTPQVSTIYRHLERLQTDAVDHLLRIDPVGEC